MVSCSKKRKIQCTYPCEWVKGKGCRSPSTQFSKPTLLYKRCETSLDREEICEIRVVSPNLNMLSSSDETMELRSPSVNRSSDEEKDEIISNENSHYIVSLSENDDEKSDEERRIYTSVSPAFILEDEKNEQNNNIINNQYILSRIRVINT